MNEILSPYLSEVPVISLIGRPNVGKSTIFNRLAKRRMSIVHNEPGVTRDRMYATVDCLGKEVRLIDTGGLEPGSTNSLMQGILRQAQLAMDESDVVIMVVDATSGITSIDRDIAGFLREKSERPVVIAVNKSDSSNLEAAAYEFFSLGFDACVPVSAAQGKGIEELLTSVLEKLPEDTRESIVDDSETIDEMDTVDEENGQSVEEDKAEVPGVISLAVIGKPNAGKSSFLNKLLGEDRHLVSDEPGTTVDAVDSLFEYGSRRYRLIDTAGIRRKRSIFRDVEKMAVSASLGALDRCAVALFLVDAMAGITEQDLKVAAFAEKKAKGVVIVVNKWDLAKKEGMRTDVYAEQLRDQMPFLSYAPIRFVSALTGSRVFDVLGSVNEVADEYYKRISTSQVNRMLEAAQAAHQPPVVSGRRVKIYYGTQVAFAPPTFMFTCNDPDGVHFSYRRFLINRIREAFGFKGVPVRLVFRAREKTAK